MHSSPTAASGSSISIDADGVDERIRALGAPAGVIQLLDRHDRDSRPYAGQAGCAVTRRSARDREAPFEFRPVSAIAGRKEVALWWPEQRPARAPTCSARSRSFAPATSRSVCTRFSGRGRRDRSAASASSTCWSATARACTATGLREGSRKHCGVRDGGSRAGSPGCRGFARMTPLAVSLRCARRPLPAPTSVGWGDDRCRGQRGSRTRNFVPISQARGEQARARAGGAFRPASRTGGFDGSASGAAAKRGGAALRRGVAVERRPLPRRAAVRADQRLHRLGRHLLPVLRPRRARDRLVHQRPAEVVDARRAARRRRRRARASPTTPGCS